MLNSRIFIVDIPKFGVARCNELTYLCEGQYSIERLSHGKMPAKAIRRKCTFGLVTPAGEGQAILDKGLELILEDLVKV